MKLTVNVKYVLTYVYIFKIEHSIKALEKKWIMKSNRSFPTSINTLLQYKVKNRIVNKKNTLFMEYIHFLLHMNGAFFYSKLYFGINYKAEFGNV